MIDQGVGGRLLSRWQDPDLSIHYYSPISQVLEMRHDIKTMGPENPKTQEQEYMQFETIILEGYS